MYYEEKVIDGQLCYRNAPDAPWAVVEYPYLVSRLVQAERKLNTFDQARDVLKEIPLPSVSENGTDFLHRYYDWYERASRVLAVMEAAP